VNAAFSPLGASATLVAPSGGTSASTTLPGIGGNACRIYNNGTVPVTIHFGQTAGTAVALATDTQIPPGAVEVLGMPNGCTDFALWGIGGAGSAVVQRGDGM
jgi:hypothetical protein